MPLLGWVLLIAVAVIVGVGQYFMHKGTNGPSHCMGCGKCDKTGVCILTNKPVGPGKKS